MTPDRKPHFVRLSDIAPEPVEWLVPGFLPIGEFSLIDGEPAAGKSTLLGDLGARLTVGAALPGASARPPMDIVIINPEDQHKIIRRRIEAAGGDPDRVRLVDQPSRDIHRPVDLSRDIQYVADHFVDPEVGFIGFDNITLALGRGGRTEIGTRETLHEISHLGQTTSTTTAGIRHLRKGRGSPMQQGSGFMAITGVARSVSLVGRAPDDPNATVWAPIKTNLDRPPKSLLLEIIDTDLGPTIQWLGATEWCADDLLRTTTGTAPKLALAEEMLRDLLADGPRPRNELRDATSAAGISWRTTQHAKANLGVTSEQVPEPGIQGPGPSWWALPDPDNPATPTTTDTPPTKEHQ